MKHPLDGNELRRHEVSFMGKRISVCVVPMHYRDGSLALQVYSFDPECQGYEPFGVLTVNLCHPLQTEDTAFVKNYSENEEWAEELAGLLGEYSGVTVRSGYVSLPLYRFDTGRCYM